MPRTHPFVRALVNASRAHRLNYGQFNEYAKQARRILHLKPVGRSRALPQLLSDGDLRRFYEAIDKAENIKHQLLLRLMFYTAVRVSELCNIEVSHINLRENKIFISQGKGSKDRVVLFPDTFRLTLQTYLASVPQNKYLFESRLKRQFSTRQIQRIVQEYAAKAGLEVRVHPHLFRHQALSFLTAQGLSDSQIQLVSGHSSKASLQIYQHLALSHTAGDYQEAMRKVGV